MDPKHSVIKGLHCIDYYLSFSAIIHDNYTFSILIKGILLSKALTCMKIFLYKQKRLFIKETDTFGHIVVWHYTHTDHFTHQRTAFETSIS